jgi:UDP-glucuronate decarboxylase
MDSPKNIIGPINLGNPTEFKVSELAELIIEKTKSKSKIVYMNLPQDDPRQRKPDINKARTTLDWNPIIDLSIGLDQTIEYFSSKV